MLYSCTAAAAAIEISIGSSQSDEVAGQWRLVDWPAHTQRTVCYLISAQLDAMLCVLYVVGRRRRRDPTFRNALKLQRKMLPGPSWAASSSTSDLKLMCVRPAELSWAKPGLDTPNNSNRRKKSSHTRKKERRRRFYSLFLLFRPIAHRCAATNWRNWVIFLFPF